MTRKLRLAVLIGSTREQRLGDKVGRWFLEEVQAHEGFDVDLIDVAAVTWPSIHPRAATPEIRDFAQRIDAADAFVIVTPEYNHSFPGHLKHAIDQVNAEWHAKPVGFVSYGGVSGGLRAVEHLRHVFAELHAVTVRDAVSFHGVWNHFDDEGPKAVELSRAAAVTLLSQLEWWAGALSDARSRTPYLARG